VHATSHGDRVRGSLREVHFPRQRLRPTGRHVAWLRTCGDLAAADHRWIPARTCAAHCAATRPRRKVPSRCGPIVTAMDPEIEALLGGNKKTDRHISVRGEMVDRRDSELRWPSDGPPRRTVVLDGRSDEPSSSPTPERKSGSTRRAWRRRCAGASAPRAPAMAVHGLVHARRPSPQARICTVLRPSQSAFWCAVRGSWPRGRLRDVLDLTLPRGRR
jgi:hypothetical protein